LVDNISRTYKKAEIKQFQKMPMSTPLISVFLSWNLGRMHDALQDIQKFIIALYDTDQIYLFENSLQTFAAWKIFIFQSRSIENSEIDILLSTTLRHYKFD
jgi:hypothetical protein